MSQTIEEIRGTIRAARDSVWMIEHTIQKINDGKTPDNNLKGDIERNVGHLKLVLSDPEVTGSGENIDDLHAAVATGETKLADNIWV